MTRQAGTPPTRDKGAPVAPPPPPAWRHYLWVLAFALFFVLLFVVPATRGGKQVTLDYSQFLKDVSTKTVKTVTIEPSGSASGTLTNGKKYTTAIPPQAGQSLLDQLSKSNVAITAKTSGTSFGASVLSWLILLLPFLVLGFLWWRLSKGAAGRLQGAFGAGRSKAKVFDEERPNTTFADVAGYDGAKLEIREVVDFLQHPERYARAGAQAPRGVLMVGPPGTPRRDGRLRSGYGRRGVGRHQPARGARPCTAAAGALRSAGHHPAADPSGADRNPRGSLPGQASRSRCKP
jgi:cell division protease FtsH